MKYALITGSGRVGSVTDVESADMWTYPDGMYVVEADGFEPDPSYNLSDYFYANGTFALDEEGIAQRESERAYSAQEVLSALLQETDALDALPDAVLARMAPYMAEWKADCAYRLGDKVQYLDRPYRVLQDHTSHEAYPPDAAVSLYARILAGGGDDYPVWEQPESTNPYMKGDRVHYPDKDGPVYESTIDNNVFSPEVYPAGWQLVEEAA